AVPAIGPGLRRQRGRTRSRPRSGPRSGGARGADGDRRWDRDGGARPRLIVSCRDTMPRFKLTLEYVGTRYRGWQIQKNARTVGGELHRAVKDARGRAPGEP